MLSVLTSQKETRRSTEEDLPPELVRDFVIAGHMDLEKVKRMHEEHPALLNAAHPWKENDHETAIQAAAQMGNVPVAEYLLSKGAPLEICTAAMLGKLEDVRRMLSKNPKDISATGAHGIPLLAHAALSGNLDLVQLLFNQGAHQGVSFAFHNAVNRNDYKIARWLLETGKVDLAWKNYQGKTALAIAGERGYDEIVSLLKQSDATE
jgi:ankyrin repeat protein